MNTDLNLIASQANSPLTPFQEGVRKAITTHGRIRQRFGRQVRPRRERVSLSGGTMVLRNLGSVSDRHALQNSPSIGLYITSTLTNPSDWSLLKIEHNVESTYELSDGIKKIIGENGLQRFEQFKRYDKGWEFGTAKPLSSQSIESFKLFSEQFSEPVPKEPSLFLTREGNLQLGWEDRDGNKIEIEFFPSKIEYYIEALDDEGEVALTDISKVFDKLKLVVEK